jgi:starch-binding outer membrane protein, SusD/RagB family
MINRACLIKNKNLHEQNLHASSPVKAGAIRPLKLSLEWMRKIAFIIGILITSISCEDYLDVPRDSLDLSEEDIFTNYLEYRDYLSSIYHNIQEFAYYPYYGARNGGEKFAGFPGCASDEMRSFDNFIFEDRWFNVGAFEEAYQNVTINHNKLDMWYRVWKIIRISCIAIENIDMLEEATEQQKNELLGQAYFARAYAYQFFLQLYGGMPYLTQSVNDASEFDQKRLSYHETVEKIVADFNTAATLLPARWDNPDPLSIGYLATEDIGRFTSVAAKAYIGRVLLYDASPLVNTSNDKARWERAAAANWEAIEFATDHGYLIQGAENYSDLFYGEYITNEHLHIITPRQRQVKMTAWTPARVFIPYSITKAAYGRGLCVTQDMVDKFEAVERDGGGSITHALPVDEAESQGILNPQDPYNSQVRDPRFYMDIIYHGRPIVNPARNFDFSEGSEDLKAVKPEWDNKTGYYVGKFWSGGTKENDFATPYPCILLRLGEVYMNYAEAVYEAYGAGGSAPGASLSGLDAVNAIRERVGMPAVNQNPEGYSDFREYLHNERAVELCFEGNHRFVDVRRWKIIDTDEYRQTYKIHIVPDETNDLITYPTGYVFTKMFLEERPFYERLYFFPVPKSDLDKSPLFKQNPGY